MGLIKVLLWIVLVVLGLFCSASRSQQQTQEENNARQLLSPGTQGIGEVFSVRGDEFDRIVNSSFSSSSSNSSDSNSGSDESSGGGIAVAEPEDSLRTDFINRRKVDVHSSSGGQHHHHHHHGGGGSGSGGGNNQDLSFTGILNGLLDSFINDPPAPASSSTSSSSSSAKTPSVPSNEEEEEDDELDEEMLDNQHPSPSLSLSSSSSNPSEDLSPEEDNSPTSEEPLDDELDLSELDEPSSSPPSSSSSSSNNNSKPSNRPCSGECRNIIFGLFLCDEIDNEAFCSEPGLACCVNNDDEQQQQDPLMMQSHYRPYGNMSDTNNESKEELLRDELEENEDEEDSVVNASEENNKQSSGSPSTSSGSASNSPPPPPHPPPQRYPPPPKYNNRLPPPNHYAPHPPPPHYYYQQNAPPPPNSSPMMMHHHAPPRIPLPCPRYCVKNFLDPYCSERLPSQFACGVDGFCCGHDVPVGGIKDGGLIEDDNDNNAYRNDGVDNEDGGNGENEENDNDDEKKVLGPCTEEIGSCVSRNIISIICFAHATPTDMYTCPRSSMKCCARKTALPKDTQTTPTPPLLLSSPQNKPSDNNSIITRNSTSNNAGPNKLIPPPPQILPQFAPAAQQSGNLSPPPPHHHHHPHHHPPHLSGYNKYVPSPPPSIAETPPPPLHSIPSTQYTSPFTSTNSLASTRVPPRQPVGSYVCGVKGAPTVSKRRRKKRVVGGSDSLPGEWCWQVALINSLNQYLCGGALIGTQWVLTAAHCVTNIVRSGDAIYVRVGDHDLTSRYGSPGAQTLRVATTYIHHNHNSQTLDNDIALLKLQGNAALKEGVCLVCLPSRNHMSEIPGKRCIVTGYGYMGESGPIPLRIREANLPIVSEEECVRKVNAVTEKVFALPMSSFCAGGELRNDACQGDGGGPLVCHGEPITGDTGTGYYELTGLVSWGFGCGRENVPGVYVKVSSFIGWIHQIIRSN